MTKPFSFDSFCLHDRSISAEVLFGQKSGDANCDDCGETVYMGSGPGTRPRNVDEKKVIAEAIENAIDQIVADRQPSEIITKTSKSRIAQDYSVCGQFEIQSNRFKDFLDRARAIKKRLTGKPFEARISAGPLYEEDLTTPTGITILEVNVKPK